MMIEPISSVDLRFVSGVWPFAVQRQEEIAAHWSQCVEKTPTLWDGRVLAARFPCFVDGHLSAEFVESGFSAFLAWRDWDYPDSSHFSLFGSAVIRSREGYLLFGQMANDTSSPGWIYPPGGGLEPADVDGAGKVQVFASILRELSEETGLDGAKAETEADFLTRHGQLISVNRVLRFDQPASELQAQIRQFIADEAQPELADIVVLQHLSDIDTAKTKPYAITTARHLLVR